MGVIYKLKPEIKEFILKKKQADPLLSCRKISALVQEKFQLKLSKSRINYLTKEAGLSMPIGRRRKKRRSGDEVAGLGAFFLKAADYLAGGSQAIAEAINKRVTFTDPELLAKTEALLYSPLFKGLTPDSGLWTLINHTFTPADLSSYLADIQKVTTLTSDISRIISTLFQEVRMVKVILSTGNSLYLDGQLHTVWSTPNIPYDFSLTIYNLKSYIKRYLKEETPFIFFMAPGYDMPIKDFFEFISALEGREKEVTALVFYGHGYEELEEIRQEGSARKLFIFGLWPWQFTNYRRIKLTSEFRPFTFAPLGGNFYLADIEGELLQPNVNKGVILRGCALKRGPQEKICLMVVSNATKEEFSAEQLATLYLSRWPNLEEGFRDFSRKIELFTYTAGAQRFFSTQNLILEPGQAGEIKGVFEHYLKALDLYSRWHFLPAGYEEKDFALAKERFYDLKGQLKSEKGYTTLTFRLPADYSFAKDLEYVLNRLNEKEVLLGEGNRFWFL